MNQIEMVNSKEFKECDEEDDIAYLDTKQETQYMTCQTEQNDNVRISNLSNKFGCLENEEEMMPFMIEG